MPSSALQFLCRVPDYAELDVSKAGGERSWGVCMSALSEALEKGEKVVIGMKAGKLWGGRF